MGQVPDRALQYSRPCNHKIPIFNMHRAWIPEPNPRPNEINDELICEIHGGTKQQSKNYWTAKNRRRLTEGKKLMVFDKITDLTGSWDFMTTAEAEIEVVVHKHKKRLRVKQQQMNICFEAITCWRYNNYCALQASSYFEIILADECFLSQCFNL